jgi:hypothetical protein
MATVQDVAAIAQQAIAQRLAGDATWTHNKVTFDLDSGGYCARFVRQCHEAAIGVGEFTWAYCASTARNMEALLRDAGLATDNPQPGDIIAMNNQSAAVGHIGIFLGGGQIAENTSSGSRGNPSDPGTKISPLSAVASEVSGYYAALPAAPLAGYNPGPIKVVLPNGGSVDGWLTDHAVVGVAALGSGLGLGVSDHVQSNRTVVMGDYTGELPASLPQFPGYTPGPLTVVTTGGQCDGWLTNGLDGHAIVAVRAVADLLGYQVRDEIPAARQVVLVRSAGGV